MRDVFFFNLFVTQGPGFSPKRKKNTGEKKLWQGSALNCAKYQDKT